MPNEIKAEGLFAGHNYIHKKSGHCYQIRGFSVFSDDDGPSSHNGSTIVEYQRFPATSGVNDKFSTPAKRFAERFIHTEAAVVKIELPPDHDHHKITTGHIEIKHHMGRGLTEDGSLQDLPIPTYRQGDL